VFFPSEGKFTPLELKLYEAHLRVSCVRTDNLPPSGYSLYLDECMRFLLRITALAFFAVATLPAQQSSTPAAPEDLPDSPTSQAPILIQPTGPTAVFDTSMGRVTCRLFEKEAPIAVANFIGLADGSKDWTDPVTKEAMHGKPFYNGTTFHRVIPGFMIQGGDPTASGAGDPGYYFPDEVNPNLNFDVPGRLAMANAGPNTNGSQFFITEAPDPALDQHYSIFGQCDESGVLIVKSIARVERDANDKPLSPVTLIKVSIVQPGQPIPAAPPAPPQTVPAPPPA
jgi:peptidyl-prolyl cis-trans isomerase A (cyclophilin A)